MDSDWQEVLNPPSEFIVCIELKGQFTRSYLDKSGLCTFTARLTSLRKKVRQIQLSPPNLNQYAHIIATIAFDSHQELLWVGDDYVSLPVHHSDTIASDARDA